MLTTDLNSLYFRTRSDHRAIRSTGNTDPVNDYTSTDPSTTNDPLNPGSGGGLVPADAPEPATALLLGAGLLATGVGQFAEAPLGSARVIARF